MTDRISTCPCCSRSMIRYVNRQQPYWFCRYCWQELPCLTSMLQSKIVLEQQLPDFLLSKEKESDSSEMLL